MFVCLTLIYGIHVDIMIIHPEVSRVRKVFLTFSQCFKRIAAGEGAWDLVKKKKICPILKVTQEQQHGNHYHCCLHSSSDQKPGCHY